MKATLYYALCLLLLFVSCSKDKNSKSKSLAEQLEGTLWSGEMRYVAKTDNDPYTIYWDKNGVIEWNELSGTYTGTYTVNENNRFVLVTFDGSGSYFKATINSNKELKDFTYDPGNTSWTIINGRPHAGEAATLSGVWTGTASNPDINFKSASQLQLVGSSTVYNYTRKHGTIRFGIFPTYYFFGVVGKNTIKGLASVTAGSGVAYIPWQVSNF